MWKAWLRIVLYALAFAVASLIVSAVEPFGVDDVVDNQSRDVLYRTFAPAYGSEPAAKRQFMDPYETWEDVPPRLRRDGRVGSDVTTVYVNETVIFDMRAIETNPGWEGWRPTYEAHTYLVLDIAEMHLALNEAQEGALETDSPWIKPAPAVFFDFLFVEAGPDDSETRAKFNDFIDVVGTITKADQWSAEACATPIERLLCIKDAGGLPLIFAEPVDVPGASVPELLNEVAILSPVAYAGLGDGYPTVFPADETGRATPASLLYLAWCMDNPAGCAALEPAERMGDTRRRRAIADAFNEKMRAPLSIVWGSDVHEDFVRAELAFRGIRPEMVQTGMFNDWKPEIPDDDRSASNGAEFDRKTCRLDAGVRAAASLLFRQIFGGAGNAGILQNCPYHIEIPYSAIPGGHVNTDLAKRFFDGKAIVVGAQFQNALDIRESAVHGDIWGMHGHAMALDNLITFGGGYIRSPQGSAFGPGLLQWLSLDSRDFANAVTTFFITLFGGLGQWWVNERMISQARTTALAKPMNHWMVYGVMLALAILIVALSTYLTTIVFRIEPPNWIGHLAVAVTLYVYLLRDEFFDDIGRFMRKSDAVGASTLNGLNWWMSYFDLETVGFEKLRPPSELKDAKNTVVRLLYPERKSAKQYTESALPDPDQEPSILTARNPAE